MEIYVIRHTQVAVAKDTCYGQSDVPLADTFLDDVSTYKNQLPHDFDAVFCSPLLRCRALAEALEFPNIIFENALMEMSFGDWEGKKWNDINQEALNYWMQDFVQVKTPNGENLATLFERVRLFLDNLRKEKHQKVLICTHAGVIRCIWAYLLQLPLQNIFKIPVNYQEIFVFRLSQDAATDTILRKT